METPTFFGFALNRIVAFFGPYLAAFSGVVATWLTSHVHLFATFHVGDNVLAKAIAQAIVFAVTTGVVYAGQHKWLDGFQKWAYGVGTNIANTELPPSYYQQGGVVTGAQAEAAEGFGPGEPPASG